MSTLSTQMMMEAMKRSLRAAGPLSIGGTAFPFAPEPEPLPEREQSEPILGFRGWNLVMRDGSVRIRSVTAGDIWEGPILRADDEPRDVVWGSGAFTGEASNRDLGIFAYTLVEGAYRTVTEHSWPVTGLVELFGKVVVHDRGYRAEACRIRELWIEPDAASHREALAARYQCEVHVDDLPTDAPLHVDDLNPDECPMCGHEHPDEPLNCEEQDHGDRQAEGDRASEGTVRTVPWDGGRARIPAGGSALASITRAIQASGISASKFASAYLMRPNP